MTRMITIKQSLLFRMRNFVLKFMMKFDLFKNLFLRRNNQISLRYPSNELIVKSRLSDFRSGKAMPGMQYIIDSDTFDLYNDMDYKHFYLFTNNFINRIDVKKYFNSCISIISNNFC